MSKNKEPGEEKPKGGKAKKLITISVGALVIAGAGAGAGLYAANSGMMGHAEKEDPNRPKLVERSEEPAEAAEGEEGKEPAPKVGTVAVKSDVYPVDPKKFEVTYFPIEQNFTANLADSDGFVQVGLSLSTYYDGKVISNIKQQSVPIRSAVLLILSQQDGAVLSTHEGKKRLQDQIKKAINRVLREKEGFGGIDNVYFTNLVIQ